MNITESPDYQRIKKENEILQAETARHMERSELQDVRAELERMKALNADKADITKDFMTTLLTDPDIQAAIKELSKK